MGCGGVVVCDGMWQAPSMLEYEGLVGSLRDPLHAGANLMPCCHGGQLATCPRFEASKNIYC